MRTSLGSVFSGMSGLMLGAGVMYFFDRTSGRRRRALARDKAVHFSNQASDVLEKRRRDISNRVRGRIVEMRNRRNASQVDDSVLHDRVRSQIGHVCSHPGLIDIEVSDGRVTLSGVILTSELHECLDCVRSIRGVQGIKDQLETVDTESEIQRQAGIRGSSQAA